jgi:hypothetical protein
MTEQLSVLVVQAFLNGKLKAGQSVRNVHILRQILSAALSRTVREELIVRNVARLVELPTWEPAETVPWSAAEALAFLKAAANVLPGGSRQGGGYEWTAAPLASPMRRSHTCIELDETGRISRLTAICDSSLLS